MAIESRSPPRDAKLPPAAAGDHDGCLSTDPFKNSDNQQILNLIDELIQCGVSETVGIPRIVIVGDQSSGKSSLLHSLTDIPFPVGDGLCTRFPTQIRSRRGPKMIKASIHQDPSVQIKIPNVDAFARTLPSLTSTEFGILIKEASTLLGLALPDEPGLNASSENFSTSTLKIELTGPDRTPFTITDLPGLFHASTSEQSDRDMAQIRSMVMEYIGAPGTIIVGVTNGLVNVAMQEIFQMAREQDPDGSRTIGVITKCDVVGDTTEVLKLALNKTLPLVKHGWFVVRNRNSHELKVNGCGITNQERRLRETELFSSFPWSQLNPSHCGVDSLRTYLSSILLQLSRSKLPEIRQKIRDEKLKAEFELQALGPSRAEPMAQRQFLIGITAQFRDTIENALNGHYGSSWLLEDRTMKLRKRIVDANSEFENEMYLKGHTMEFMVERVSPGSIEHTAATTQAVNLQPTTGSDVKERSLSICDCIREEIDSNRGTELPGTLNPEVVPAVFRRQISNWGPLAQNHLETIKALVQAITNALLRAICRDDMVFLNLQRKLLEFDEAVYPQIQAQLNALIQRVYEKPLQTNNRQFLENIQAARRARFNNSLTRMGHYDKHNETLTLPNPNTIFDVLHFSNCDNLVVEAHDILKVYYDIQLQNFMGSIKRDIIEHYVTADHGRLKSFSPIWVGRLKTFELGELAIESKESLAMRKEKNDVLQKFKEAEELMSDYS